VLELSWLGVVASLPRKLLAETISKPNKDKDYVITAGDINLTSSKNVSATMIPVHEGP
jgi:hypothetical protein